MTNYFEALAQQQMVAATKAKHRAAEKRAAAKVVQSEKDAPMKLSAAEQEVADQSTQLRAYKRWKRAEIEALLKGPNGANWWALSHKLKTLTLNSAHLLVDFTADPTCWLHATDLHTRQTALSIIAARLIVLRLEAGMAPMDDSLPGEEPTMFEIIRKELKTET